MVLRKITIDNSVRHIPKTAKTKEGDIKPNKKRTVPFLENKMKKFHKAVKNFLIMWQHKYLEYLNEY